MTLRYVGQQHIRPPDPFGDVPLSTFSSMEQGIPESKQIVEQLEELWKRYGLEKKTQFETRVEKVYKDDQGR